MKSRADWWDVVAHDLLQLFTFIALDMRRLLNNITFVQVFLNIRGGFANEDTLELM